MTVRTDWESATALDRECRRVEDACIADGRSALAMSAVRAGSLAGAAVNDFESAAFLDDRHGGRAAELRAAGRFKLAEAQALLESVTAERVTTGSRCHPLPCPVASSVAGASGAWPCAGGHHNMLSTARLRGGSA